MVAEPGSAFIYGPAALQVFHQVLKEKLRGDSPTHYLERRVLHRLGLGSQRYLADRAGNPLLATGWILTARQWAKLGQLVLANGTPVISPNSLAAMLARNHGQSCLFARLVEQSRCSQRSRVRLRADADSEMAKSGLA